MRKGANYIQRTPDKWKQNIAKKQRQCGENYKSKSTGEEVQGKVLKKILHVALANVLPHFQIMIKRNYLTDFGKVRVENYKVCYCQVV